MTSTNESAPNAGRHEADFETTYDSNINQNQTISQPDSKPLLCSGYGQFHTYESGKQNRKSYAQINLEEIRKLVDNPQEVDKPQAQWLIPSTLLSRTFREQEANGIFHLLWADIDVNPNGIDAIGEIIANMIPGCDCEIYTSKSATKENQKCRILIPSKQLIGSDWVLVQEILNDKLEAYGIQPDRTSEGAAQLCYLPNRGAYYNTKSKRDADDFDPVNEWVEQIQFKREKETARIAEQESRKCEAKSKREAFNSYSGTDAFPSLIHAFNAASTVQDILLQAGYEQKNDCFRHPNSESGSFSASVKNERVHSLSSNDPLYTGGRGGGAHDAFSAFTVLFHISDEKATLRDAGDSWVMIGSEPWNTVKQREYVQANNGRDNTDFWNEEANQQAEQEQSSEKEEVFSLKRFALNGNSEDMESQMLLDTYVLNKIAILGQATVIYAKPNTGKTLLVIWLLIEAIKSGAIKGEDVYYINADDNFKGLVHKLKLAESYGFQMLAPGHNDFESRNFLQYIRLMVEGNNASEKVIILDTLKKFTNLMDKKTSSDFMRFGRAFVSKGGTLILLAHTNKKRDEDNKVIFGGTSDIVDDVDCAYTLDEIEVVNGTKKVLFENIKSRGNVAREVVYSYSIKEDQTYTELLESVKANSEDEIVKAKKQKQIEERLALNAEAIEAITEAIDKGFTLKTDLIDNAHKESCIGRRVLIKVLDEHTGNDYLAGNRWQYEKGDKNAKNFRMINAF